MIEGAIITAGIFVVGVVILVSRARLIDPHVTFRPMHDHPDLLSWRCGRCGAAGIESRDNVNHGAPDHRCR